MGGWLLSGVGIVVFALISLGARYLGASLAERGEPDHRGALNPEHVVAKAYLDWINDRHNGFSGTFGEFALARLSEAGWVLTYKERR